MTLEDSARAAERSPRCACISPMPARAMMARKRRYRSSDDSDFQLFMLGQGLAKVRERAAVTTGLRQQVAQSFVRVRDIRVGDRIERILGERLLVERELLPEALQRAVNVVKDRPVVAVILVGVGKQPAEVGAAGILGHQRFADRQRLPVARKASLEIAAQGQGPPKIDVA